MKKRIFIWAGLLFVSGNVLSQSVGGIQNHYLRVSSINGDTVSYFNSAEDTAFHPGDKVLMIQMTGTYFEDQPGGPIGRYEYIDNGGSFKGYKNCGNYEILQIAEIDIVQHKMAFTAEFLNTYDTDELIQLVKVAEYENATIDGTFTAKDWSSDSTGGIAVLIVYDTLTMLENINVNGKGFRGALPEINFTGTCRSDPDTVNFLPTEYNRAGNKGEGNITLSFPYTKGSFYLATGGGGGNGLYSGGGGGSNYGSGGKGGRQDISCDVTNGAMGGMLDNNLYVAGKITMGGGGGSGVQSSANTASKGGDGGGITIIMANVLIANDHSIRACGEDVPGRVYASGGGGGAGGTILLDVNNYKGNFDSLAVAGGKGGNTYYTGTGGGGGGGVVWYSGTSIPYNKIDISGGLNGGAFEITQGSAGNAGKIYNSLILPLNGFLFNTIKGKDTICGGQKPDILTGSKPKGGNGSYTYQWQQSPDKINWSPAQGQGNTTKDFTPDPLDTTTWFRRIVTSEPPSGTMRDTSRSIEIFVYPAIGNNNISGADTICYGRTPLPVTGTSNPTGGDETNFTFQWLESLDNSIFNPIGSQSSVYVPLSAGSLTATHYYKRFLTSTAYCSDTSETVKITVVPLIGNNGFATPDTTVCENENPKLLASQPVDGFGSYSYLWQKKETGPWTSIQNSNSANLITGLLSISTQFRRIVFSGDDLGCTDTSENKTVTVLPSIKNNDITGSTLYTCYNSSKELYASTPVDGESGDYAYLWQISDDLANWSDAPGTANNMGNYIYSTPTSSAYFRRIVYSSAIARECMDTSDYVHVMINQLPTGDIINIRDTLCAGESVYVKFTLNGDHGPWKVTAGNGTGISETNEGIPSAGIDSLLVTMNETGIFTLGLSAIEDDSTCMANSNLFTGEAIYKVYEVPQADAGENAEICGPVFTLNANKSIAGSTGEWSVNNGSFDDPQLETATVTMQNYGPTYIKWSETNWQCTDSDSAEVIFYEQPVEADAGPDQLLDFVFQTNLAAINPAVGSGEWTFSKGEGTFDDVTSPNTLVKGLLSDNILKWTVTNGVCIPVSDSMNIMVNTLKIPAGFRPNEDGFAIKIENTEKIGIIIFNRLGKKVFESDDYTEGNFWTGTNENGIDLPEGTYFYVLKVKIQDKPEEFIFKSFVELIRDK